MLAIDIEGLTRANDDFRREVATAEHGQVVLMTIPPVRLWTVCAPPEHPPGTVHRTKAEADAADDH